MNLQNPSILSRMRFLLISLLFFSLFSFPTFAEPARTPHVIAELISENHSLQSGKADNLIGLRLEMAPQWHTYWRFPGDSGLPTEIVWHLPKGWKAGPLLWELPERILLPPLVNFGYSGETILGSQIEVPAGEPAGHKEIRASVSWLVCKEECIPEKVELSLSVNVSGEAPKPSAQAGLFPRLRREQPKTLSPLPELKVEEKRIGLRFADPPKGELDFFPLVSMLVKSEAPPVAESKGGKTILWFDKADPFDVKATAFSGVLIVNGKEAFEFSLPLAAAPAEAAVNTAKPAEESSAALLVLFAFLGGLILNLMPCVFPVLGIKVMALVRHEREHARAHSLAYTLGVVLCFWALAAVLILLRSFGQALGWGFQLQYPPFVIFLILLFSFVTADFLGLIRWSGSWMGAGSQLADRGGYIGSLFTGVLAVLVATPCTAPFMGTALGATIGEAPWVIFLVFTALGLGLALPFLVLCSHPSFLAILPKPGLWMDRLKKIFAIPLALTVVWLIWVLMQQVGGGKAVSVDGAWQPYSEKVLQEQLNAGKPVFVDFTAAWCLTCQVNKRVVLDRESMQQYFREKGVVLLLADWTNRDPEITKALEKEGRVGLPLYLAYPAGATKAHVLPQILTEAELRSAFP